MQPRLSIYFGSFLSSPVMFCVGLSGFFGAILFLFNQLIYVDADGDRIQPASCKAVRMPIVTGELIDLTREHGWRNDPVVAARVSELMSDIVNNTVSDPVDIHKANSKAILK